MSLFVPKWLRPLQEPGTDYLQGTWYQRDHRSEMGNFCSYDGSLKQFITRAITLRIALPSELWSQVRAGHIRVQAIYPMQNDHEVYLSWAL